MAGSIGPTGLVPGVASPAELDQVAATFAEQAAALVEGGVDLFVLETFRHLEEIRIAIDAARRAAPGLPIIASMAFDPSETVADGSTPEQVATTLRDWGADVIGVNCGDGPQLALAIAERMRGGRSAALRAAQRRPAAHRRRSPPLYGHAGVPRRVRAPHDPARAPR